MEKRPAGCTFRMAEARDGSGEQKLFLLRFLLFVQQRLYAAIYGTRHFAPVIGRSAFDAPGP